MTHRMSQHPFSPTHGPAAMYGSAHSSLHPSRHQTDCIRRTHTTGGMVLFWCKGPKCEPTSVTQYCSVLICCCSSAAPWWDITSLRLQNTLNLKHFNLLPARQILNPYMFDFQVFEACRLPRDPGSRAQQCHHRAENDYMRNSSMN